jgi:cellulose synthase operon protein C
MSIRINFRFLLASLAVFALLGVSIYFLHTYQVRRHADFLLERARQAKADKRFDPAVRDYQAYLRMAPKNADAQAELGLLLADQGQAGPAIRTLETALRLAPERNDLRKRLVELDIAARRTVDARAHLQFLLASSPDEPVLWEQLGFCQAGEDDRAALQSFEKSIQLEPARSESYVLLAAMLNRLDRAKEAGAWMAKLVANNPKSPQAHALLARQLSARSSAQAAAEEAEQAAALAPQDFDMLLLAANLAAESGEYEKAHHFAERAIAVSPARAAGYRTMVQIELRQGDSEKALASLRRGIEKASDNAELLWDQSQFWIQEGKLTEAQAAVDRLRRLREPSLDPIRIDFVLAEIDAARGHWAAAARAFSQVLRQLQRPDQNLGGAVRGTTVNELLKDAECRLAACYRELGDKEAQLAAYRKAAEVDPLWPTARLGIAATLASLGQLDEALEEYRKVGKINDKAAADIQIARLLVIKNLRLRPAERDWTEVESILARLAQAKPDDTGVALVRAEVLLAQGRREETEKLLLAARDTHPDSVAIWAALIQLAQQQPSHRAIELLDAAEKKFGDSAWIRLARAARLLKPVGHSSAVGEPGRTALAAVIALGNDTARFSAADRLQLHRGLAMCLWEAGELEPARKQAELACADDGSNLEARLLLFDLADHSNDTSAMQSALDEIHAIQGESAEWHYGKAGLQAVLAQRAQGKEERQSCLDRAFAHLFAAQAQRPQWGRVPLLRARLYDQLGQVDQAGDNYRMAVDAGETDNDAVRRAFQFLYSRQRFAEADAMLRHLEQRQAAFVPDEMGRLASEVSMRMENADRALAIARRVAAQSNDWADHAWLGQVAAWLGVQAEVDRKPDEVKEYFAEAEKAFRRSVEISPHTPDAWIGLIRFLALTGQKEQAAAILDKAVKKIPAAAAASALGTCYEILGRGDEAAAQYQRLLVGGSHDPRILRQVTDFCLRSNRPGEAAHHLQTILGKEVSASPQDLVWARRTLAGILRSTGRYEDLLKAVELIGQNLAGGAGPEDLEANALLHAVFPQRSKRRQAIDELEKVVALQTTDIADARFALASLYLREKDWPHCQKHMQALLSRHGNKRKYVATYVALLLKHDELPEAELWLERLDELSPGDPMNLELRVELLVRRRQVDLAIQLLRAAANGEPGTKGTDSGTAGRDMLILRSFFMLRSAAVAAGQRGDRAAQTGLLAEADTMLTDYLTRHAGQEYLRASLRMLQGKTDEALALAEKSWPVAEPKLPDTEIGPWVSGTKFTAEQAARLDRLLLAALERQGRPTSILQALGELRSQYRPQVAADIERELVNRNPNDLAAVNQLALIVGLQKKDVWEALKLVNQAIALAGPVPSFLDTRAVVLIANDKPQEALGDLEDVVRDDPQPIYAFHRAWALSQLGQQGAATDVLIEARRLGLKQDDIPPLERPYYEWLVQKLGLK